MPAPGPLGSTLVLLEIVEDVLPLGLFLARDFYLHKINIIKVSTSQKSAILGVFIFQSFVHTLKIANSNED